MSIKQTNITSTIGILLPLLIFFLCYGGWGSQLLHHVSNLSFISGLLSPVTNLEFTVSVLLMVLILIIFEIQYIFKKNGEVTDGLIIISIIVIYVWADCRFLNGEWDFVKLPFKDCHITYFDTLIAPFLFFLCIAIITKSIGYIRKDIRYLTRCFKSTSNENKNDLSASYSDTDSPIRNKMQDLLDRTPFAERVVKHIDELDITDESTAVAIIAPWGNGKTSFINLVKEVIRDGKYKKTYELIDFNPWRVASNQSLTEIFFNTLIRHINPVDVKLSGIFRRYIKALKTIEIPNTYSIPNLIPSDSPGIAEYFDKSKKSLSHSDKKYLVIIDDLDRLKGDEILEVLKLIRSTANFPNLIFICAFDKHYVCKTLSQQSLAITENYLEKFFQLEYWLPAFDSDLIKKLIINRSKSFLDSEELASFTHYLQNRLDKLHTTNDEDVINGIVNIRMALRWINGLKISHELLKGEVWLPNLADLELLKVLSPYFYDVFRSRWKQFVEEDRGKIHLWGRQKLDINSDDNIVQEFFAKQKSNVYEEEAFKTQPLYIQKEIKRILSRLLPDYGAGQRKHFSNIAYTDRYFYYILQDKEMSDAEFQTLFNEDIVTIKDRIITPDFAMKTFFFVKQLNDLTPQSIDDLKKYLQTVFFSGKHLPDFAQDPYAFIEKLSMFPEDTAQINEWILSEIISNGATFFPIKLVNSIFHNCTPRQYQEFFSKDKLKLIAKELMPMAISEGWSLPNICAIFWETCDRELVRDNNGQTTEKYLCNDSDSNQALKIYWEDNLHAYAERIICKIYPGDDSCYNITRLALILWGEDLTDLKLKLASVEQTNSIIEISDFIQQWSDNDKKPINYTFKYNRVEM